jgi:hypothetical protein
MKNRPGSPPAPADRRPKYPPARGASAYSAAAAMLSASRHHKNHIGPLGQNGSAIHCDQYADQLGSAAETR